MLDVLTALVDKSLVQVDAEGEQVRYRLLESVRQYALERLQEAGEEQIIRSRHRDWYLALAETAATALSGPDQKAWLDRLEMEHDNLRTALNWCWSDEQSTEAGLRLVGALAWFWLARGYGSEGRSWLTRWLPRAAKVHAAVRARALIGAARLAWSQGDLEQAIALGEQGLAVYRALGERGGVAMGLATLALAVDDHGDAQRTRLLLEECIALARDVDDKFVLAEARSSLGRSAAHAGDYEMAAKHLEEGLILARAIGDRRRVATALAYLGLVAMRQGDFALARRYQEESLALKQMLGLQRMAGFSLVSLGLTQRLQGDLAGAWASYRDGLGIVHRLGDRTITAWALEGCAGLCVATGQWPRAARLLAAAAELRASGGAPLPPLLHAEVAEDLARVRAVLDAATFQQAWAAGQHLPLDEIVAEAVSCEQPVRTPAPPPAALAAIAGMPPPDELGVRLTPREMMILRRIAAGRSSQEIAADLAVSVRTVERHITNLYTKLGVRNRAEATRYALHHALA